MQAMTTSRTIDDIVDAFALIDDWEERYRYVIELGKDLPGLKEAERIEDNRVKGCASNVWLVTRAEGRGPQARLTFEGESDAHIVKGLVAVTLAFYSGRTAEEIASADAFDLFRTLGFEQHLTPQRSNGVRSMVDRIRKDARAVMAA